MSGRKQHFIPQSLLRGFGREGKGKKTMVVAYTYGRGIFTSPTDGVGAEREFYSELSVAGGEPTLDDRITAYETSLAKILQAMRGLPNKGSVEKFIAAEFVTHLIVRNDYFRKTMSTAGAELLDGFSEAIMKEQVAKFFFGFDGDAPSEMLSGEMAQEFSKYKDIFVQAGIDEQQFAAVMFDLIKNNFRELHRKMIAPAVASFRSMEPQIADAAANAQRRVLGERGLSPQPRVEKLAVFDWKVIHTDVDLILPDCVAMALDEEGVFTPLMLAEFDQISTIFMPLATSRLLVGTHGSVKLDLDQLNAKMASCSWDFFVAAERTPAFETLQGKLRTRAASVLNQAVAAALSQKFDN